MVEWLLIIIVCCDSTPAHIAFPTKEQCVYAASKIDPIFKVNVACVPRSTGRKE